MALAIQIQVDISEQGFVVKLLKKLEDAFVIVSGGKIGVIYYGQYSISIIISIKVSMHLLISPILKHGFSLRFKLHKQPNARILERFKKSFKLILLPKLVLMVSGFSLILI
jgi:hypothetical protein